MPPRLSPHRADGGFALPGALLAVIAVSAIVSVLFATAISEQRATRVSQDFENSVHAAEAGVDRTIAVINEDNAYVDAIVAPTGMTPAAEWQWAVDAANNAPAERRVVAANGWGYGFRPVDLAGTPLDLIYGVGVVTEGPYSEPVRVLRIQFDSGYFRPQHAILTEGNLRIEAPVTVQGSSGSVHANGTVTLTGTPRIDEGATYSTGASGTWKDASGVASPAVQAPPEDVPQISAISFYESRLRQETGADPGTSGTWYADGPNPSASGKDPLAYDGDWFDMCLQLGQPTATVRVPADEGQAPCTGAVYRVLQRTNCGDAIELDPSHPDYATRNSLFRGWHAHVDYWHICHEFPEDAGIFFLNGGAGKPTKIGVDDVTHSSRITIISDHGLTLDKSMHLEPYLEGYLLQAEGTLDIKGEHNLTGGIASRQCVNVEGTGAGTVIAGSIISNNEGGCTTTLKKTSTVAYNGGLSLPLGGIVRVTAWNELFA